MIAKNDKITFESNLQASSQVKRGLNSKSCIFFFLRILSLCNIAKTNQVLRQNDVTDLIFMKF